MQKIKPVAFLDSVLWFEDVPEDYAEDCLEFSHKDTVILRDRHQCVLVVLNEGQTKVGCFKDLNNKQLKEDYAEDCLEFSHKDTVILRDRHQCVLVVLNEGQTKVGCFKDLNNKQLKEAKRTDNSKSGVLFDLVHYLPTNCKTDCIYNNCLSPVSFVLQSNSKKYQISCSKAKTVEFLEMTTSEGNTVDTQQPNRIFYKRRVSDQYSMFESMLAQNHYLCTEFENGLLKLGLKEVLTKIDETAQIEVSGCESK